MRAFGPQDDNETRRLVLKLLARLRCATCGASYKLPDFRLQHHSRTVWVLGVECRDCGDSCHVVVALKLEQEQGPAVDLMPEEVPDATSQPPITADDVLDMHEFLHEYSGDLKTLLSR
jgi:hypothetical protein